ncbi:MAG: hypothetical protein KDD89_05430, partial [Anaerolineales bacterium]|nr:hypothetical protein [Anaerolineales bacterium]
TGRTWLSLNADGTLRTFLGNNNLNSTTAATAGQWHHAAVSYDGTTLRLYLDGNLEAQSVRALEPSDGGFWLGRHKFITDAYLDGALDDVVLFDRALTAVELNNLINGRVNPNDNRLAPSTSLRYQATVTNTSATTATGFLVAESHYDTPEIPHPTAVFSFESEQRRAFFRNDTSEENRPYCLDALTCPTLGQAGQSGNALLFDSDGDMLHLPTMDTNGDHTNFQVAFWLRVESLPTAGQRAMILDTASTEPGALDIYVNSNGNLVWDIVGDPDGPRVSHHIFTLNQWTHVAFVGHYQHFINGVSTTHTGNYWFGTAPPITIGHGRVGNNLDGTEPFRGRIDELVYYRDGRTDRINDVRNGNYGDDYQLLYRFDDAINYDGTTFYNSRNNAHTTCTGGHCPLLTIEGRGANGGRALQFDGRDDYAYQSATNTYGTSNPRTFSLYVKPHEYPSTGNIAYLYDATETDTQGDARAIFNLYMDENGHLSVDYGWGTHSYTALDPLPLDEWSKIAVTFERRLSPTRYDMTLRLNDTSSSTVDICNNAVANCFHQIRLSGGNFGNNIAGTAAYNGLIDEVDFSATALNFDTPFVDFGYENLASQARTSTCLFRTACPSVTTGQFADGLAFDGQDFLIVNTPINPAKTDFSASLWFKTSDFSDEPILLQQEDRNGTGRTWLGLNASGNLYSFLGNSSLTSNTAVSPNQWHHAAVSYDGTTLRLYLDGLLVASDERAMETNNGAFWVGRPKLGVGNGFDRYFTGELDELVIVPHALEADAVQLLRDSRWPMIDVPDEFVPYSATALTNQLVSGTAVVNPYSATSLHRFEQEVEAALVLQAQINYPIVDDNAGSLEMFFPFEDGPGTAVFDNLISYPNGFINPDLEAVCANAATCPTAGLRGQVGRAAYFDGQDDYLFMDAFDYSTVGPNEVTAVSVWVNAAQGTILDIDRYNSLTNSTLEIDLNRVLARDTSGTVRLIPYDAPRNEWFHLVLTIDASDQATIYVNGEPVATGELGVYFQNEVHSYTVGANNGGQDLLHGYLDDLRLYSTPLTQADVTTLYETSAPVLRFEFDEDDEATQFTDNSVNQLVGVPRLSTAVLNGITVTQPSPAPGTAGRIGNGALFDGQSYIEISDPGPLRDLTNDFTIMAWVRPDSVGSGVQRLLAPGLDDSINGYSFGFEDGNLLFHTHGVKKYLSTVTLEPDRWQHVAVVFDASNNASFYLDGDFQQTVTGSSP